MGHLSVLPTRPCGFINTTEFIGSGPGLWCPPHPPSEATGSGAYDDDDDKAPIISGIARGRTSKLPNPRGALRTSALPKGWPERSSRLALTR